MRLFKSGPIGGHDAHKQTTSKVYKRSITRVRARREQNASTRTFAGRRSSLSARPIARRSRAAPRRTHATSVALASIVSAAARLRPPKPKINVRKSERPPPSTARRRPQGRSAALRVNWRGGGGRHDRTRRLPVYQPPPPPPPAADPPLCAARPRADCERQRRLYAAPRLTVAAARGVSSASSILIVFERRAKAAAFNPKIAFNSFAVVNEKLFKDESARSAIESSDDNDQTLKILADIIRQ